MKKIDYIKTKNAFLSSDLFSIIKVISISGVFILTLVINYYLMTYVNNPSLLRSLIIANSLCVFIGLIGCAFFYASQGEPVAYKIALQIAAINPITIIPMVLFYGIKLLLLELKKIIHFDTSSDSKFFNMFDIKMKDLIESNYLITNGRHREGIVADSPKLKESYQWMDSD